MKKDLRNTRNSLLRLSLLWLLAVVAATAWAAQKTVVHSFADIDIYGNKTPQLFFADPTATVPEAATNMGLSIDLCPEVRLTFVYDATKVTGDSRPRTVGAVSNDARHLRIYGNKDDPTKRVRLVFTTPYGAKIKSLRIEGPKDLSYLNHTTRLPSATNTLLLVDDAETTDGATFAVNGTPADYNMGNFFLWQGSASTLSLEKTTSSSYWQILSFTVVYEPDATRAAVPAINGSPNPFLTTCRVTISSDESGATYYYTTDDSEPTEQSTPYTAPFTISKTTTVKAIATKAGKKNSGVATATIEKQVVRSNINDLLVNATNSVTEYVQLKEAVVNWVKDDTIYLQDPAATMQSGLRLVGGKGNISLQQGDKVTGLLKGYYSPNRNEIAQWSFNDENSVKIAKGAEAPVANVELADIASATTNVGITPKLDDKDYLYQRVRVVATVSTLGATKYIPYTPQVVNALVPDVTGVQIALPEDYNTDDVTVGGTYAFTGLLYDHVAKVGTTTIGFRTLYVMDAAHVTSPQGLPLGSLKLKDYEQRLLIGDEWQIGIESQSHEAPISFASTNEQVATVNAQGVVRVIGAGQAAIKVTLSSDGKKGEALQWVQIDAAQPVYQLPNNDFSQWESIAVEGGYSWAPTVYTGSEPVCWNGYAGMGASESQMQQGSDGSVRINASTVERAHYPGILTNAEKFHLPLSSSYQVLYDEAFVYTTQEKATPFNARPTALRVVLKGQLKDNNGRVGCVLYTPGIMSFPITDFSDTDYQGTEGTVIATAVKDDIAGSDDWQEITIPFLYKDADSQERPSCALMSIVTDAAPSNGTASDYRNDYLDIKSVTFVYETEATATIGKLTLADMHTATYVAQQDVAFPSYLEAYIAVKAENEKVLLQRIETAAEGEAVILLGAEGTHPLNKPSVAPLPHSDNLLQVSDGQTATGTGIYVLGATSGTQAAFHRYTGNASLSEGRVYLKTGDASARSLDISFASDEQATLDVKPIAAKHTSQTAGIYDLQGRKLNAASRKGVYVAIMTDGSCRKIFVK